MSSSSASMKRYTISEYGKQNMFAHEPPIRVIDQGGQYEAAEKMNGRWAMIGFVALFGAYVTTGQIIPGIF